MFKEGRIHGDRSTQAHESVNVSEALILPVSEIAPGMRLGIVDTQGNRRSFADGSPLVIGVFGDKYNNLDFYVIRQIEERVSIQSYRVVNNIGDKPIFVPTEIYSPEEAPGNRDYVMYIDQKLVRKEDSLEPERVRKDQEGRSDSQIPEEATLVPVYRPFISLQDVLDQDTQIEPIHSASELLALVN